MQRIMLLFMFGWLCLGTQGQAAITEVLLFPHGAVLSSATTLQVEQQRATFQLPDSAVPDSLQIAPTEQVQILNYQINSVVLPAPVSSQLEQQLEDKKQLRQQLLDKQRINALGLEYWHNQKNQKLQSSQDIQALGAMIIATTTPMVTEASRLKTELIRIEAEINELEHQLNKRKGQSQRVWQVTLQLAANAPETLSVNYTYRITSARWQSNYTLAAHPADNVVDWLWQAQLSQSSGEDWHNVDLKIATSEPHTTLTPPEITPWVIRERQIRPIMGTQSLAKRSVDSALADNMETMAPVAAEAPLYQRSEGELFDIYALGKQTIIAGQTTTLTIAEGKWQSEFSYLLRPQYSSQVFLSAAVSAPDQVTFPTGAASLLVDGVVIGKRNFSFHGKEQTLYFGSDPALVSKITKKDVSDRNGLFNKKRTLAWEMSVSVTNHKNYPIDLTIEDAYPRVSDKRIELKYNDSDGEQPGEVKDGIISWQKQIEAGSSSQIAYGYSISYPEDMNIIPGR